MLTAIDKIIKIAPALEEKLIRVCDMKLTGILIFSCVLSVVLCLEKARYDNYRLYEVQVEDGNHQKLLKTIDEFPDGVCSLNLVFFAK